MFLFEKVETDVLIIGGGGAAARAALEAYDKGVRVLTILKGHLGTSGATVYPVTDYAGFQASHGCNPSDNPGSHFQDILDAALGMCDPRLARIVAEESPEALRRLEEFGVPFMRDAEGKHVLGRACFSSEARSHRILGHGKPIMNALIDQIRKRKIRVDEDVAATGLLMQNGKCIGALAVRAGRFFAYVAKATILATGGAGQLFKANMNPTDITGDGYIMAYRAGATLVNMEFMQAGLAITSPLALVGAWIWSYDPAITNSNGIEFLREYLPAGVTPRDVFSEKIGHYPFSCRDQSKYLEIRILREMREGRQIYLDLRDAERLEEFKQRPLYPWLLKKGLDLTKTRAPISVFAHAVNGGILIDERAASTIPGLFAAGEVAGGPHGADRLGGGMLPTCQVFGARAGTFAASYTKDIEAPTLKQETVDSLELPWPKAIKASHEEAQKLRNEIQNLMFDSLLIERNGQQLSRALDRIKSFGEDGTQFGEHISSDFIGVMEAANLLQLGKIMIGSANLRIESRGSHYRTDFPERNDREWNHCIIIRQEKGQLIQQLFNF
jgi:fumarate reductase (CoM/CoB) subunit A